MPTAAGARARRQRANIPALGGQSCCRRCRWWPAARPMRRLADELALACASHNGEPNVPRRAACSPGRAGRRARMRHALAVAGGGRPRARRRRCATALHNNCSGKHAGFLCLGLRAAWTRQPALRSRAATEPQHAVMREVRRRCRPPPIRIWPTRRWAPTACSIPTFAIPLDKPRPRLRTRRHRPGLSADHARAQRLRGAIARAPFMVAGTGRFRHARDGSARRARLLQGRRRRRVLRCPAGAGWGVAIKVDDGNNARAAEVAMAAVIEPALRLDTAAAGLLRSLSGSRCATGTPRGRPAARQRHAATRSPAGRAAMMSLGPARCRLVGRPRPRSLLIALSPVLVGALRAARRARRCRRRGAGAGAALLMQLITNLQNDVGYTVRGGERGGEHGTKRTVACRAPHRAGLAERAPGAQPSSWRRCWPRAWASRWWPGAAGQCWPSVRPRCSPRWPGHGRAAADRPRPSGELTVFVFFGLVAVMAPTGC